MILQLLLAHPAETPLRGLADYRDLYDIALERENQGRPLTHAEWVAMNECRTVGELAELVGEAA